MATSAKNGDFSVSEGEALNMKVDLSMSGGGGQERENAELPIDMSMWTPEEVTAYNNLRSKRKKCCIGGCTHRSLPLARSYHQLPVRNKETWVKWVEIIRWSRNEPEWSPNGEAAPLVCSRHFPDTDFISYEASSRVRLSHAAIPMHYVDPPEGTVMDPKFSGPLPIPPMIIKKEASKEKVAMKKEKLSGLYGKAYGSPDAQNNSSDNMGYDIEEVQDSYEESSDNSRRLNYDNGASTYQDLATYLAFASQNQSIGHEAINLSNRSQVNGQRNRLSAPPALFRNQNQIQKPRLNLAKKKQPPALISCFPTPAPLQSQSQVNGFRNLIPKRTESTPLVHSRIPVKSQPSTQTKHKIGIAKCRLIVQTLENQLKIAKMRLAEQLDVPYQVVHGVWNMKDSLKERFNNE